LGAGLGYGVLTRIVLVIMLFVPLVNLVVLLALTTSGTTALKASGYKVGLFGARQKLA
jgi:hypothetical protein